MLRNKRMGSYSSLWESKRGIAVPVTFLMLFVSLTLIVSVTYYFSVTKINISGQGLKVSAAKQRMLSLEDTIQSLAWSPGSYEIFEFDDLGGTFKAYPTAKRLVMNLTAASFYDVFFNSAIGRVAYELPASEDADTNVFLRGDSRVVVNQSSSTMTQLYIRIGATSPEITLSYRPLAGSTVTESGSEKPTNNLRIYVINLNSSQTMTMQGKFRLKATCINVTSIWKSYDFSNSLAALTLKVSLDGTVGTVSLPISSNVNGALVNLETVACNIRIQSAGEA
jgi:hypothetical protein